MNKTQPPDKRRFFPLFILVTFSTTILSGVAGTLLPSVGFLPVIGHNRMTIQPWIDFFAYPGVLTSIFISLFSGLTAAVSVVVLAFLFVCFSYGTRVWRLFEQFLSPVLSIPHAAFAVGFAFLIAPSGWLVRVVSPELTGFTHPPDWILLNDPYGLSLTFALVIKEFPFLILVIMGALGQMNVRKILTVGKSMGYSKEQVWFKVLIPQLYPRLRLSVYAIVAYSLSVVDMAILLGPGSPPTLAVLILQWCNNPDVNLKLMASVGSIVLLLIVIGSVLLIRISEKITGILTRGWVSNGGRVSILAVFKPVIRLKGIGILIVTFLSSVTLIIWSMTWQWRFPDILPKTWTLRFWEKGIMSSLDPLTVTVLTGAAASFVALVLAIGCMEYDLALKNTKKKAGLSRYISWFIYLPLLIPQVSFMAGVQLLLVLLNLDGRWVVLVWSHLLFVLPYTFIVLSGTYKAFDHRMSDQAIILGKSYIKALFRVKLPMLLRPILFAFAIGFSVSVAQYIPTVLIGAGRFSTITTEVVNIAAGPDRRVLAVYALIQQLLPLLIYALAIMIPKILFYNRKQMQV